MRLKDKIALVTGAASGIGKEIALTYAREGAKVVIADLNQQGADAAAKEIIGAGGQALGVAMDVTKEDQVEAGFVKVDQAFGGVDVLVSNAGIQIVQPLDQFDFAKWRTMLAIHLDGAFLTTRAALRRMYQQGRGGVDVATPSFRNRPPNTNHQTATHWVWRPSSRRIRPTQAGRTRG